MANKFFNAKKVLMSTLSVLIVVAAAAVLVSTLFLPVIQVSGDSMEPTLNNGDIILLVKTKRYSTGQLCCVAWQNKLLLKRVIGLPGDSIEFLRDVPLSKCLYVYEDLDLLHELALTMDPSLTEGLSTTFSSGRYYEFNPTGVDKGSGLRELAGRLGIDIADTIACGDSANDMAMIEAAGLGVVVSNATADAVAIADYQAKSSCDDGVFAEVLEKFIEPQHA